MDATGIIQVIKDVGFPIAVAGFVLWRVDKTLRDLVTELRAFHIRMGDVLTSTAELKDHVREQGDRVIREVDQSLRTHLSR